MKTHIVMLSQIEACPDRRLDAAHYVGDGDCLCVLRTEAYEYGFGLTEDHALAREIDGWADMDDDERCEEVAMAEEGFTSTAQYANSVLPTLRRMAGCEDTMGTGWYRGCDDESMEAFAELVDAFFVGYSDGMLGADPDPDRVP